MTAAEHHALCVIIKVLSVKRNRFGKLDPDGPEPALNDLNEIVRRTPSIPHGGLDRIDQAVMVLQSLVGQTPVSILDGWKKKKQNGYP